MFLVGYKSCSTDSYNNLHLLEGDATLVALYMSLFCIDKHVYSTTSIMNITEC